jgi:hypothetical protein
MPAARRVSSVSAKEQPLSVLRSNRRREWLTRGICEPFREIRQRVCLSERMPCATLFREGEMSLLSDISYTLESSLETREVIRPVRLKVAERPGMKRG